MGQRQAQAAEQQAAGRIEPFLPLFRVKCSVPPPTIPARLPTSRATQNHLLPTACRPHSLAKCTVRCSHHQGGTTLSHVFSSFFCQSVRGRCASEEEARGRLALPAPPLPAGRGRVDGERHKRRHTEATNEGPPVKQTPHDKRGARTTDAAG